MAVEPKGPWAISVCTGCGGRVAETYEHMHDDHGGEERKIEVVPKSRLEATRRERDALLEAIRAHRKALKPARSESGDRYATVFDADLYGVAEGIEREGRD